MSPALIYVVQVVRMGWILQIVAIMLVAFPLPIPVQARILSRW